MTGLEPHPVFPLPPLEWAESQANRAVLEKFVLERARLMQMERIDPLNYGFRPEIWNIVDDLLVDGKRVILDCSRLEKIGAVNVPKDFTATMVGAPEVWIPGSNRSSKSEYGANKIMRVLRDIPAARTWSFADTGPISRARQQPIFYKYLPIEVKRLMGETGKTKKGSTLNISYTQKGGFTEETFVLPNKAQHWFKNYEQDVENVEGDQLDGIWLDELRNIELLKTLRGRVIDRGGIILVTFTSIDENYAAVVNEYERGARTIVEVDAELLPIKKPKKNLPAVSVQPGLGLPGGLPGLEPRGGRHRNFSRKQSIVDPDDPHVGAQTKDPDEPGSPAEEFDAFAQKAGAVTDNTVKRESAPAECDEFEITGYEKVPRLKVAGPGSDGNQRANIAFFHILDNPYFGYEGAMQRAKPGQVPLFGKERYYRSYRKATRAKILSRVYGLLQAGSAQQFPKFNDLWHTFEPGEEPREGTDYHIVDPCDGRNWFMIWIRIDPRGHWWIRREWPSTGHAGAYIPGIADPGPWTLPGQPADGVRGPAQNCFGWGLDRYRLEILRLEGHGEAPDQEPGGVAEATTEQQYWRRRRPVPLKSQARRPGATQQPRQIEEIHERWMDCRYGNTPTQTKEGRTTLIEEMEELDMEFLSAPTEAQILGNETGSIYLINDMLDYDDETERGKFSARLGRANLPRLHISRNCTNTIYAMREWTGKDKGHGACKDPIDTIRYAALAGLEYVGRGAYSWVGGGAY